MKTLQGWHDSKDELSEYLQPGDEVDEMMYEHFLNILPPVVFGGGLLQTCWMQYVDEKMTYRTFTYDGSRYWYHGCCHKGKTTEPEGK